MEYCESIESQVGALPEGEAPQANAYAIDFTWAPYPNAPEDCQYTFVGREAGSHEWAPLEDCTLLYDEAGDVTGARCTVTAPSQGGQCTEGHCESDPEQPVDTWEYGVSGTSEERPSADSQSPCTTTVALPGPLDPPSNPQTTPPTQSRQPGLTITWQAPQGRSVEGGRSQVRGYRVYRHADGDSTSQLVGRPTETHHVDQDVSESRSYTYEIYAADQYGVGRAAVVRVEGSAVGTSGGCSSAAPVAAPLGLALAAVGVLWRRRRSRG